MIVQIQPCLVPRAIIFLVLFSSSPYVYGNDVALSSPPPPPISAEAPPPPPPPGKVVKAIVAAAAATLFIALLVLFLFLFRKFARCCCRKGKIDDSSFRREALVIPNEFKVKELMVDENGADHAVYMTKLDHDHDHDRKLKSNFPMFMFNPSYGYEENEEDASKVVKRSTKSKSQEEEKAMISMNETPPFPAPSISMKKVPPPPPPPTPPPPPPNLAKKTPPPTAANNRKLGAGFGQLKLRPLHWDKVIANSDHSMVWDQIKDGSLRIDDELIETLFANRKSPDINNLPSASAAQIFILEPRKSQNAAIVLKSLAISREEIIDALGQGQGLCADTLEKLTKIAPTPEEEAKILQFSGSPMRLAAAESFLHHVLKAVPSAFIRIRAMLFRYNYDSEILNLKESLQTLDLACKELRSGGLFLKLLEAILKAGNRMNAGTARGNALGFNLTALQKLSHVKSIDGNTTLLHFVVEQVARSQGRSHSLRKNGHVNSDTQEDKDEEYMMLGLPALGALSSELRNVKTAAAMEYENFISMPSNITSRVAEIRQLVTCCDNNDKTGFAMEMRGFLDECEQELRVLKEEQIRVIQLVKRTTEYYQAGAGAEANPLQLFVIVKDFLDMVDRVCADITTKLRRINVIHRHSAGSSPPPSPPRRNPLGLINFRSQFISDMSRTTSSSEDDF